MARGERLDIDALLDVNPELFDDMYLPSQLDAETVRDTIILSCLDMSVVYPDPDFMQKAIKIWSGSRAHAWQKMADAVYKSYDPFINFTRDERREHTETRNLAGSEARDLENVQTRDLDGNSTRKTAAYNENTAGDYTPRERLETEDNGTVTSTDGGTINTTDTGTVQHVETFHSQGDSALFTPTDIMAKEFDARAKHDIIETIIKEFKQKFIVCVY